MRKLTAPPTENEQLLLAIDPEFEGQTHLGITGVRHTQFSIARHYGGINFNGHSYTYFPEQDQLWRDDVLKALAKLRKKTKA